MRQLEHDWLTDGLIDFEYKKYMLLAYLKDVKNSFDQLMLFPFLSDLVFHYKNLLRIKENKSLIFEKFPKKISKADFKKLELTYKKVIEDDEIMKEIQEILEFAIPKVENTLDDGKDIYEFVESNFEIKSVGVSPLYMDEGYMFLQTIPKKEYHIYRYTITVFESKDEEFRGIATNFIETTKRSIAHSLENKKVELARRFTSLPNPATFLVSTRFKFPYKETVMPIAKRLLVRHITSTGNSG